MAIEDRLSGSELTEIITGQLDADWHACTIDELGQRISDELQASARRQKAIKPGNLTRERASYWAAVKRELHILVCTDDRKYADLRKRIEKAGNSSQMTIVSMVAAAVAASINVIAGSLVPLCALGLLAIARVGRNAYCQGVELNMQVGPKK